MATLKISSDLQNVIKKVVLDTYFPVGSIYLSATPTNPGTIFGGTWIQLKNHFLFATNSTSGNKGKDAVGTHTGTNTTGTALTIDQMPSHNHTYPGYIIPPNGNWPGGYDKNVVYGQPAGTTGYDFWVSSTGGGQAHNHGVSYIEVYVWQRTA